MPSIPEDDDFNDDITRTTADVDTDLKLNSATVLSFIVAPGGSLLIFSGKKNLKLDL